MRVLHVVPSFYPALVYGGPTQSTYNLCLAEARRGCEVKVLTSNANGPRAVLDVDTRREVPVGPLTVRYWPRIGRESVSPVFFGLLPGYVRWADVVHLMAVYSFPTPPTLAACRLFRKPVVWSPRGMLQRWESSKNRAIKDTWDRLCHAVAPRGMTLCFTSDHESDESTRRFQGFDSVIIPNGVDLPDRALHEPSAGELRVVFLGRLHPIKGIENLLDGFARFLPMFRERTGRGASLVVAGGGDRAYVEELRARAERLGLGDVVSMPGEVRGEAKRALFARADVVVVPSFRESFGIVVAEALAHEVPVIAGRGTPWRRLEDEGAGLWVDNDAASLAAAMDRIAGLPLAEMGRRGRAWVARDLSWDLAAERTIALYRRMIAAQRGETA